jgi:hypothetical protein
VLGVVVVLLQRCWRWLAAGQLTSARNAATQPLPGPHSLTLWPCGPCKRLPLYPPHTRARARHHRACQLLRAAPGAGCRRGRRLPRHVGGVWAGALLPGPPRDQGSTLWCALHACGASHSTHHRNTCVHTPNHTHTVLPAPVHHTGLLSH